MKPKFYRHSGVSLLWTGILILIAGGLITYLMFLGMEGNPSQVKPRVILGVAITLISSGICFISASANWWIHR